MSLVTTEEKERVQEIGLASFAMKKNLCWFVRRGEGYFHIDK
jgi:hypothetical protein